MGGPQQVGGQEVVGVFGQLMLGQAGHHPVDGGRRYHQEQEATDHLEQPVQAFEDDADLEGLIQEVSRRNQDSCSSSVRAGLPLKWVSFVGSTIVQLVRRLDLSGPATAAEHVEWPTPNLTEHYEVPKQV